MERLIHEAQVLLKGSANLIFLFLLGAFCIFIYTKLRTILKYCGLKEGTWINKNIYNIVNLFVVSYFLSGLILMGVREGVFGTIELTGFMAFIIWITVLITKDLKR